MDADVELRPATLADAAAIAGLSAQLGYPASADQIGTRLQRLLADPTRHGVWVASVGGLPAGWIHVLLGERIELAPFAEIAALVIDADHRNHGLGARLVEAAVDWAQAHQLPELRVRSNVIRADAHRFYQRHGFHAQKAQTVLIRPLG